MRATMRLPGRRSAVSPLWPLGRLSLLVLLVLLFESEAEGRRSPARVADVSPPLECSAALLDDDALLQCQRLEAQIGAAEALLADLRGEFAKVAVPLEPSRSLQSSRSEAEAAAEAAFLLAASSLEQDWERGEEYSEWVVDDSSSSSSSSWAAYLDDSWAREDKTDFSSESLPRGRIWVFDEHSDTGGSVWDGDFLPPVEEFYSTPTSTASSYPITNGSLAEYAILQAFWLSTGGPHWSYSVSDPKEIWNQSKEYCGWVYVTCTAGSVTALIIPSSLNMVGTMTSLAGLPNLAHLNIAGQPLVGGSIEWLCSAPSLVYVYLNNNKMTGSVPNCWMADSLLERMVLNNNDLAGSIGTSFANLTRLTTLDLSFNHITGTLPHEVFSHMPLLNTVILTSNAILGSVAFAGLERLENLGTLNLASNLLTGPLPNMTLAGGSLTQLVTANNYMTLELGDWFCDMTALQVLDVSYNFLSGTLPECTEAQVRSSILETLTLSSNAFTGTIPQTYFEYPLLSRVSLNGNALSGTLPAVLAYPLQYLISIDVSDNTLEGPIPDSINTVPTLVSFTASNNSFTGTLPSFEKTSLTTIDLGNNFLYGELPPFNNATITYVYLSNNNFSGVLPDQLSSCMNLHVLDLSSNSLQGSIPESLLGLRNLETLDLSANSLSGTLPHSFTRLTSLVDLDLSSNFLTGSIPYNLASIAGLRSLSVANNRLSGTIDPNLGFYQVNVMDMSLNRLSGCVPVELIQNEYLWELYLGGNNLTGTIPDLFLESCALSTLSLSSNPLGSTIPPSLANCVNLTSLDMCNNELVGSIPASVMAMPSLLYLSLASNYLEGTIPPFVEGQNMQTLSLFSNSLVGNISSTLNLLHKLEYFDVSANYLEGELPSMSQLNNLKIFNGFTNNFTGSISVFNTVPSLVELRLANNQLSANFNFSSLDALEVFSISNNNLNMPLSLFLDQIQTESARSAATSYTSKLRELSASNNGFTGTIPVSINNLTAAISIDLAYNQLTGDLSSLSLRSRSMTAAGFGAESIPWQYLILSNNDLEGPIDNLGALRELTLVILDDNPKLKSSRRGLLPGFLKPTSTLIEGSASMYLCPVLTGVASNIFVSLDPSYYDYALCRCRPGYFGTNGVCQECPDLCTCDGWIVSGCYPNFDQTNKFAPSSQTRDDDSLTDLSELWDSGSAALISSSSTSQSQQEAPTEVELLICSKQNNFSACNPDGEYPFVCAEGYDGIACSVCQEGFYHSGTFLCSPCDYMLSLVYLVIYICVHVGNLAILIAMPFSSTYRILVMFVQMTYMLQIPGMPYPSSFSSTIFVFSSIANFDPFAVACNYGSSTAAKWLVKHTWFIAQFFLSYVFVKVYWMISDCVNPLPNRKLNTMLSAHVSMNYPEIVAIMRTKSLGRMATLLVIQMYFSICYACTRVLRTWHDPATNRTYLKNFLDVPVDSISGIVMRAWGWILAVFIVMVPFVLVRLSHRISQSHSGTRIKFTAWLVDVARNGLDDDIFIGSESDPIPEPRDKGMGPMGVLYIYSDENWYWELLLIIRRIALAVVFAFVPYMPPAPIFVGFSSVIMIALLFHCMELPFMAALSNRIELLSLTVLLAVMFLGLYSETIATTTDAGTRLSHLVGNFQVIILFLVFIILCASVVYDFYLNYRPLMAELLSRRRKTLRGSDGSGDDDGHSDILESEPLLATRTKRDGVTGFLDSNSPSLNSSSTIGGNGGGSGLSNASTSNNNNISGGGAGSTIAGGSRRSSLGVDLHKGHSINAHGEVLRPTTLEELGEIDSEAALSHAGMGAALAAGGRRRTHASAARGNEGDKPDVKIDRARRRRRSLADEGLPINVVRKATLGPAQAAEDVDPVVLAKSPANVSGSPLTPEDASLLALLDPPAHAVDVEIFVDDETAIAETLESNGSERSPSANARRRTPRKGFVEDELGSDVNVTYAPLSSLEMDDDDDDTDSAFSPLSEVMAQAAAASLPLTGRHPTPPGVAPSRTATPPMVFSTTASGPAAAPSGPTPPSSGSVAPSGAATASTRPTTSGNSPRP